MLLVFAAMVADVSAVPSELAAFQIEGVDTARASVRADSQKVCKGFEPCLEDHVKVRDIIEGQWRSPFLTPSMRLQLILAMQKATVNGQTDWRLAQWLYNQQPDRIDWVKEASNSSRRAKNTYQCDTYVSYDKRHVRTTCGEK